MWNLFKGFVFFVCLLYLYFLTLMITDEHLLLNYVYFSIHDLLLISLLHTLCFPHIFIIISNGFVTFGCSPPCVCLENNKNENIWTEWTAWSKCLKRTSSHGIRFKRRWICKQYDHVHMQRLQQFVLIWQKLNFFSIRVLLEY